MQVRSMWYISFQTYIVLLLNGITTLPFVLVRRRATAAVSTSSGRARAQEAAAAAAFNFTFSLTRHAKETSRSMPEQVADGR